MPFPTALKVGASLCVALSFAGAAGCGKPDQPGTNSGSGSGTSGEGFHSADCNGVTNADVDAAAGSKLYTPAAVSDAGCFWQEESGLGSLGAGMGISTWWYRGSDMDVERKLEAQAGRTLTEMSIDGNQGFKAYDDSACSIYVAKGGDVITWSIQTLNSANLPDLCSIIEQLARLSQDRVK